MRSAYASTTTPARTLPPPDFAELRREVDLPALVSEYTPLHATWRGEYRAACPIHGGRNLNLRIWQDSGGEWHYKCYSKCSDQGSSGGGGDAVTFLEKLQGLTRAQAVGELYRRLGRGGHGTSLAYRPTITRAAPEPLSDRLIAPLINCLDLPLDPTGKDRTTPRDWWHGQGIDDPAIDAFRLGGCPHCPTAESSPSATIPVFAEDNRTVLNIRHRLLRPSSRKGDKYRPHAPGLGAHMFNAASLTTLPDGTARRDRRIALIWEGEKKVIVGSSRYDGMLGFLYPIVSATSGVGSWLGQYGEEWAPQLDAYERVIVQFDPGPDAILTAAEQTAALFGRRGCVIETPQKVDDWLIGEPTTGARLEQLIAWIEAARPIRSGSLWNGW